MEEETNNAFQCSICFESIGKPADVDQKPSPGSSLSNMPGSNRNKGSHSHSQTRGNPSLSEVVATKCGHLYHSACLHQWFKNKEGNHRCPNCRKKVKKDSLLRVYPGTCQAMSHSSAHGMADDDDNDFEDEAVGVGIGEEEQDIKEIMHKTLLKDHEDLLKKFQEVRESEELWNTQITSLAEDNARKASELRCLKRRIDELQQTVSEKDGDDGTTEGPNPSKRPCLE